MLALGIDAYSVQFYTGQYWCRLGKMRLLNHMQLPRGTARRRVLGVVVALWVCLGIQPCAVAAVSDTGCPHRPTEQEHGMAAAHDHGAAKAEAPCLTMQADCCDAGQATIDSRLANHELKNAGDISVAISTSEPVFPVRLESCSESVVDPPDRAGTSIPFRVLYCVYLD